MQLCADSAGNVNWPAAIKSPWILRVLTGSSVSLLVIVINLIERTPRQALTFEVDGVLIEDASFVVRFLEIFPLG